MITLILPQQIQETIKLALLKADRREIGGILMAEHIGPDRFTVRELTVHRRGTVFKFVRLIEEAIGHLRDFFRRADHDYTRFNYIGEWHSHPSFEPIPSPHDDSSMLAIIQDAQVGANFVVLLIVKLDGAGALLGSVHTYLPDGSRHSSSIRYDK